VAIGKDLDMSTPPPALSIQDLVTTNPRWAFTL
jgi:hypothetical protein